MPRSFADVQPRPIWGARDPARRKTALEYDPASWVSVENQLDGGDAKRVETRKKVGEVRAKPVSAGFFAREA